MSFLSQQDFLFAVGRVVQLLEFRKANPIRGDGGDQVASCIDVHKKPTKVLQQAYHAFQISGKAPQQAHQEWFYFPFLIPLSEAPAELGSLSGELAGKTALKQVTRRAASGAIELLSHPTNISASWITQADIQK